MTHMNVPSTVATNTWEWIAVPVNGKVKSEPSLGEALVLVHSGEEIQLLFCGISKAGNG